MSVMEHANLSVDSAPQDQLEQDFVLDFESNVDNVEDGPDTLDFVLDGTYDQAEHILAGDVAEGTSAGDPDSGLNLEHDGSHATSAGVEPAQGVEVSEIEGDTAEGDYQEEEIGYEDDEFATTGLDTDLVNPSEAIEAKILESEVIEAANDLPDTMFREGELEPARSNDDAHAEGLPQGGDVFWQDVIGLETQGDVVDAEELEEAGEEDAANLDDGDQLAADDSVDDTMHDQSVAGHGESDLDKALEDLTDSLAEAPDIEVLYNEECFSLFGTADDDPDSYFLSDLGDLDCPLSQFLAAVRAVITDEVAPADELLIRFDPLGLEFGERSNEKFLSRSFREVFGCYTALRQRQGTSLDPVIHLSVRKDSEEHFLELLAEAKGVEASPDGSTDSEMSDHADQEFAISGTSGTQFQDELSKDGDLNGHHREGEDVGTATSDDHVSSHHVEVETQNETEQPLDPDTVSAEYEQDAEASASAPHSFDFHAEEVGGEDENEDELGGEVDLGEESADTHPHDHEHTENGVDDEHAWDGRTTEDVDATGLQHAEASFDLLDEADETTDQLFPQDVEESTETAGFEAATVPENGTHEQEAGSNDDDLILAFNDDAELSAVHDEHADDGYDKYTGTFDVSETVADNAEGNQEPDTATDTHDTEDAHDEDVLDVEDAQIENAQNTEDAHDEDVLDAEDEQNEGAHDVEDANDTEDAHYTEDFHATEGFRDGDQLDVAVETASIHTSTTVNGDEVDYQEETAAGDDLEQPAADSGVNNDEIDWENDEDEDDEQPSTREETVKAEEPQEAASSPPSASGKRSRTDEAESLADETDHKRRRT